MAMVYCRGCAKEIHESAVACPNCGSPQSTTPSSDIKSQSVAALLAAFLGGFGIHRFYLRRPVSGVLYLLFCWTGIPGLMAIIETYIYAFKSQESWARKYNNGQLSAPVNIGIKILTLIFPILFVIGILAAIAIPAYHGYKVKAEAARVSAMYEPPAAAVAATESATAPAGLPGAPAAAETVNAPQDSAGLAVAQTAQQGSLADSPAPSTAADRIDASFDCAKAAAPIEKVICSSPESAAADKRMASAYAMATVNASDKDQLKSSQRQWLKEVRNQCRDSACLVAAYDGRIGALGL
jgi:TM2 domain-containing membrane protein YozV/uncharacterized protein YecT (DUF1311 family)